MSTIDMLYENRGR